MRNFICFTTLYKQENLIFFQPLRSKLSIINIWVSIAEKLINGLFINTIEECNKTIQSNQNTYCGHVVIDLQDIKRLFIVDAFTPHKKIFSLSFPFSTYIENGCFKLKAGQFNLSNKYISILKYILEDPTNYEGIPDLEEEVTDFILSNSKDDINSESLPLEIEEKMMINDIKSIFHHLLLEDDGYFRFDHDPEHENGDIHPTLHLDFFFNDNFSVKFGLRNHVKQEELKEIINPSSSCYYLNKSN